jgi:hypothetical protein
MSVTATANIKDELEWAAKKGRLVQEVFNVQLIMQKAKTNRS